MNPDIQLALLKAEMARIKAVRDVELEARDVLSGHLSGQLALLFPKAPAEFLASNGHFANELARGAGEIADAVSAAQINWTGPTQDAGVDGVFTKALVRLLAVEALVTGKIALFPRINEVGQFEVEALAGYLHPVLSPTNALSLEAVLQVLPVWQDGKTVFEVRRYSPGMLEVFPPVSDWSNYADGRPEEYPQTHAAGRLPLAFAIVRRDAHRQPFGLVAECLSAFRRYAKTAVNRNAVQEIAGWPERVVKSDQYLQLYMESVRLGQAEHPAITGLKDIGPRKLKLIATDDTYEVQEGVDPGPHIQAEGIDKQALLDLLRSPDLTGGNATGVALAERQTKSRALVTDLCDAIAALVTDACDLAAGLTGSQVPEGIEASLSPRWAADSMARATAAGELFAKAGIPRSVLYMELQSAGWKSITDAMIEAEQARERGDLVPDLGGGTA